MTVGDRPRCVTRCRATSAHSRSGPGKVGRPFVQHQPRPEQQRSGDGPRAHHPAEVGEPQQGVPLGQVERVGEVLGRLDREAAVDMDGALGLTGGPRRVDQQVRRLRVAARRRRAGRGRHPGLVLGDMAPPLVPAVGPRHPQVAAGSADDEDVLDRRHRGDRGVGDRLEVHPGAAPEEPVGGDQELRPAVLEPARDRRRGIAREDRREDGPEPTDRQDRDDRLREHRQQDPDPIALPDPEVGEPPRRRPDGAGQRPVRELASRAVLALPDDGDAIGIACGPWLDGGPRPVERATQPPPTPGRSTAGIEDRAGPARPGDPQVVGRCAPEPRRVHHGVRLEGVE